MEYNNTNKTVTAELYDILHGNIRNTYMEYIQYKEMERGG